ncbi:MAG: DNA polymerase/3'-5' exonuclease PolX, partial [Gaiellaceae bacterium]
DIRDANARAAGEAGVPVLVSSDAHRPHELVYLDYALSQARRAWLTKAQVLNTRTWPQIRKLMKS